jgi:HEAT repeat protein
MFQPLPPGSGRFTTFVPALLDILATGDRRDQERVLQTFSVFGPDAAPAVPYLVSLLDSQLRELATEALGAIGPDAAPALPKLVALLQDNAACSDHVHVMIPTALARIGDPAVVPALIAAARNPDDQGPGWRAIDALGMFGAAARSALPFLLEILDDSRYAPIRGNILEALVRIGPATGPAWNAVVQTLQATHDPWERAEYVFLLYTLTFHGGPAHPDALSFFTRLAADPDEAVRTHALIALNTLRWRETRTGDEGVWPG